MRALAAADFRALGCDARLVVTDPDHLEACRWLLEKDLATIDATCSRFRSDSELASLDTAGGRTTPIGALLGEALSVALRAAEATDGDVDPTVGSAMNELGYDRDFTLVHRDGRPVRLTVRPVPGWRRVRLDRAAGTVTMPPGTRLDLGATAKAWAADRAAQMLAAASGCGVLVSLGGDTAVAGKPPEGGWRIRVQDITGHPDEPATGPDTTVAIREGGLATSGTSARRWRRGGQEMHHIVDPRTGRPVRTPWRTVTVAAATCADANTASTAALVRAAAAYNWLERLRLPARLVATDGSVVRTTGWPQERKDKEEAA
ncbi:FAD:protein FMN transferase [Actinacidiphila oryziradicis]|uniref:FAD:protein FMN transferase n=1 Tax=Actinacidiphila oryziradicis TaxID=2571141 RepID=A0A4U0SWP2_9ACTN|nr:FAD:protein FMN transferase [Actinacidiphila oryziradicis]TKA04945.1 FAD:protein FMN transferase [Actinacidiphila oryziradicis]